MKAGGTILTDLFSKNGEDGFIDDVALLESLVSAKLAKTEKKLLKEGFAWVDVSLRPDHEEIRSYGRPRTSQREPNAEEQATLTQLQQEQDQLDRDIEIDQKNDDYNEALAIREDELAGRWDAYNDALMVVHPGDVACVGALVTINSQGKCEIIKNLLRPEDVKRIRKEEKATHINDGVDTPEKPRHSERLTRELTAQRTAALQAEMINRPDVALVTLTAHLAKLALYDDYYSSSIVKIACERDFYYAAAPNIEESKAWQAVEGKRTQIKQVLPKDSDNLFTFLLNQDQAFVLDLLAFCMATILNAVQSRESVSDFTAIAQAVNLNMCNWWTPTQESYFKHISRAAIIEVISEAVSPAASNVLHQMKKGVAAAEAERLIAHTAWVPTLLQTA